MKRNDLTIYDSFADNWWSDDVRWVRTLKNLVPGRLKWFDRHIDWQGKAVLDLGCAGGFMAEALHDWDAFVANPLSALTGLQGMIWYGGLAGGFLATLWPIHRSGVAWGSVADSAAPASSTARRPRRSTRSSRR